MKPFVIVLCLGMAAAAAAQEPPRAMPLTLEDAVARAVDSSHRLVEAAARRDQTAASVDEQRAAYFPQIAAIAGYDRTNHVTPFGIITGTDQLRVLYPDLPDNYRTRLDALWPIYTGGRVTALADAARRDTAAAGADLDALKADVTLDVTRAFWNLVAADEAIRVVDESLTRMGAHLRDVRTQLEAGLVPPNDVLSAQAQESHARLLSIQAAAARDIAEADLAQLIGAPAGTAIKPTVVFEPVGPTEPADALVAKALANRRDRQALVDRVAAARFRQQAAQAERRPTIAVGGGVDYANPNPRIFPRQAGWQESWDASLNVSWRFFDGGRVNATVAEADANRRALQARLDEFDSLVARDVHQRLAEINSSGAAIESADVAVRAATEARRVVVERFSAGVATSTDVLDAQQDVLQASLDRTRAMVTAKLAEARLRRVVGQ